MIKLVCENFKVVKENDFRKSKWEVVSYLEIIRDVSLKWIIVKIWEIFEKFISFFLCIV